MSRGFLLDTCAVIWMSLGPGIDERTAGRLSDARDDGIEIFVSAVTAWEMGMLVAKGRINETKAPVRWYRDFLAQAQVAEQAVSAEIFIASSFLPALDHRDPIDRILIATARERDLTLITRDRAILAYGAAGHVKVLAC